MPLPFWMPSKHRTNSCSTKSVQPRNRPTATDRELSTAATGASLQGLREAPPDLAGGPECGRILSRGAYWLARFPRFGDQAGDADESRMANHLVLRADCQTLHVPAADQHFVGLELH